MIQQERMHIHTLLHDWHEAGRYEFESTYTHCDYDKDAQKISIERKKYITLNEKSAAETHGCGVYLVEKSTGNVYRIKAYGVPNRKKCLGNISTLTGQDLYQNRWY